MAPNSTRFWELAVKTANPSSQSQFIKTFDSYTTAVVQEAEDRSHRYIRNIDAYLAVRRNTIGAKPSFALLQLDLDLPHDFLKHPVVVDLTTAAIDMIILANVR